MLPVLPLPCNVYISVTWSTRYWNVSQTVAHPCASICQSERRALMQ